MEIIYSDPTIEMIIRPLNAQDAVACRSLRLRGLQESPTAFSSDYAQEARKTDAEFVARVTPETDGSRCTFGAFVDNQLVGMVAFVRPPREKLRHWAELGGMYVAPEFRRRGFGRALVEAAVAHARSVEGVRQLKLSVNATNAGARQLYQSLGFECFGVEPEGLCVEGIYFDEESYVLRLVKK
jgi:RimJ/RimL family protein N-acetyltransferase